MAALEYPYEGLYRAERRRQGLRASALRPVEACRTTGTERGRKRGPLFSAVLEVSLRSQSIAYTIFTDAVTVISPGSIGVGGAVGASGLTLSTPRNRMGVDDVSEMCIGSPS